MSDRAPELHPATMAISRGRPHGPGAPINPPIGTSSTYRAGGDIVYGREDSPSWSAFEEVVGALEGGRALAFSSGMAAIAAVLGRLPASAVVVAPGGAYTGTRELLTEWHELGRVAEVRLVDPSDTEAAVAACEGATLVWLESPTNPMLEVADIPAIAAAAHLLGLSVAVDNTFATPIYQRPLELGADVVVHSATKFLGGHSDLLMGVAVTRDDGWYDGLVQARTYGGAIPGTLEAFLALRGLRTLDVRLERASKTAAELAARLLLHPAVEAVRYPGFGAMVSFDVAGGAEAADKVCGAVRLVVSATSLGGVETSIERRSKYAGEERTPPGLVRMSVGLEHIEDLWADLDQALG